MVIKWTNVICFALFVFLVVALIHMHESVAAFLRAMGDMGPEHSTDEKIWGLITFGVVMVGFAGILTILIRNQK
jgi:hypothetical protein